MFKNISYVSISYLYVNILGYIFHLFVSRNLGPEGYGEFIVLYALILIIGNITNILSMVSVKTIVEHKEYKYEILRYLRLIGILSGVILASIGIILSPLLKNFLKVTYLPYIWTVCLCWLFMFIVAVERGFMQATDRFGAYAFSSAFELTIRLATAIILLYLGFYILGAIFSTVLGLIATLIYLLTSNKNLFGKIKKIDLKKLFQIALYSSPSGFFVYLDDIFIKRIFSSKTAGLYASSSIFGKALLWFCVAIFFVFFPELVEKKEPEKVIIKRIFILNFLIFLFIEIAVITFGKDLFLLLYGEKFSEGYKILKYYIISIFPLNLCVNFVGINTAREKNLKLIYTHLIIYLSGFILIPFNNVFNYLIYIFSVNSFFLILNFLKIEN